MDVETCGSVVTLGPPAGDSSLPPIVSEPDYDCRSRGSKVLAKEQTNVGQSVAALSAWHPTQPARPQRTYNVSRIIACCRSTRPHVPFDSGPLDIWYYVYHASASAWE